MIPVSYTHLDVYKRQEQYLGVVKPMYHQFIEPTKRYADVIIPEGVTNTVAIDLITTKIEKILNEAREGK